MHTSIFFSENPRIRNWILTCQAKIFHLIGLLPRKNLSCICKWKLFRPTVTVTAYIGSVWFSSLEDLLLSGSFATQFNEKRARPVTLFFSAAPILVNHAK